MSNWYFSYGQEREKFHPCHRCKAAGMKPGMKRCHFLAVRWGDCDVCKLPIMKDECRGSNGTVTRHSRCLHGPRPRPELMDLLECLPELEMAA